MRKNSLTPNKGLSLSQAQSISNLCNQRAREIEAKLSGVNNYKKTVKADGDIHTIVAGKPLPKEVVALLKEKASLHATQAFLMENIKAKDALLRAAKTASVSITFSAPEKPKFVTPVQLGVVDEEFGWSQLSVSEQNEYLEAESYAAHIGQFIHAGSTLDRLRVELPNVPSVEWMVIVDGKKSPVTIEKHHTSEQLLKVHEELAGLHRAYEQRVNYFKAKVKNLTTEENARIAKLNADAQNEAANTNNGLQATYDTAYRAYSEAVRNAQVVFEKERQESIKNIAAMRIGVDPRFQETVNTFLAQISDTQE
jgi:hypothetical protein